MGIKKVFLVNVSKKTPNRYAEKEFLKRLAKDIDKNKKIATK